VIPRCEDHTVNVVRRKDCIKCRRIYYNVSSVQERKKLAELMDQYKLEKGCAHCGYKESVFALEFDHIKPREDTSKKWQTPKYKKAFLELTADPNIQVLCSNCHRIKTRINNDHKSRSEATQLNTPATNKEGNN